jgi:N-acetylglutamate synthase-like GNAT family acetyltransferase
MNIQIQRACKTDESAIRELLESNNLPTDTVGTDKTDFYLARSDDSIVGVAGFEHYGDDALLRSVAVPFRLHKKQIGSQMVDGMIGIARQNNVKRIILLTTTASGFFAKKGFTQIERSVIRNRDILESSQFQGGCCSSAVCMIMEL